MHTVIPRFGDRYYDRQSFVAERPISLQGIGRYRMGSNMKVIRNPSSCAIKEQSMTMVPRGKYSIFGQGSL